MISTIARAALVSAVTVAVCGSTAPIHPKLNGSETVKKTILIVYAQPEPTSLTHHLVNVGIDGLQEQGHEVLTSDLYGMRWKAVFDADDFPSRVDERRLSFIDES